MIVKTLADNKIDEAKVRELKNAIYNLALFSSEKTINALSVFIRNQAIGDQEEVDIGFFSIISQFRKDLKLEGIDEFAANEIEAIESLLKTGFEYIDIFREIRKYFNYLRENITSSLKECLDEELFKELVVVFFKC